MFPNYNQKIDGFVRNTEPDSFNPADLPSLCQFVDVILVTGKTSAKILKRKNFLLKTKNIFLQP